MAELASLPVQEAESYAGNFPKMSQPKEVACYSRDGMRRVQHDKSALRPYRPPKLPAVLDEDFEKYIPKDAAKDGEPAPLGDLLAALAAKKVPIKDAQIVTYRNNLNKIFLTPYQRREDWEVGVEKREDGVVLLHVRETERKQQEEAARDERSKRMAYWGYRFEQLSTLSEAEAAALVGGAGAGATEAGYRVPSPSDAGSYDHLFAQPELGILRKRYAQQAATTAKAGRGEGGGAGGGVGGGAALGPVNANEEYCSIVQLTLDKCRLLMAAEIDCVAESPVGGPNDKVGAGYVELKTSKQIASSRDMETYERHKLLKFWLQSFLAGVPSIVVGFRDDAGIVRELKSYETKTLHRLARGKAPGGKDYWNPTACFNFGKSVLDWLLAQLAAREGGGAGRRFVLRYDPQRGAILLRADDGGAKAGGGDNEEQPAAKRQRGS